MSPWTQTQDQPGMDWYAEARLQAHISHDTTCMDKVDCKSRLVHIDQAYLLPALRRTVEARDEVITVHKQALNKARGERDRLRAQRASTSTPTDGFNVLAGLGWFIAAAGLFGWAFGADRFATVALISTGVATASAVIGALHRRRKAGAR